jgi:hypothetical protein
MESEGSEKAVDQQASRGDAVVQAPQKTSSIYKSNGSTKVKSKIKRKIAVVLGPAAGLLILVLIIFMLMSLLKIPNYASNIAAYRLASSAREYASTSAEIDAEKIALSELDAPTWKTAIYDKYSGMRSATWGKFDKYRPSIVYKNLNASGDIAINDVEEKIPVFGGSVTRTKITSIDVYGKNFEIPKTSRILHPFQAYSERVKFAADIRGAIDGGLKSSNSLVRSSVASQIREAAGIKLSWWEKAGAKFKGLNADEADIQEIKDSVANISETPSASPIATGTDTADVAAAEKQCLETTSCLDEIAKTNEIPESVAAALEKDAGTSFVKSAIGFADPAYAIAVPLCLIYAGSVVNQGPAIDSQSTSALRSFYAVQSAADQQKSGKTTAEAVGAFNDKLGSGDSIPDQYSRGQTPNTTTEKSPQSSLTGEYTLFGAIFGGNSAVAQTVSKGADTVCSVFTNVVGAIIIGVIIQAATFILDIPTGGGASAGEEGALTALKLAITTGIKDVFSNFAESFASKAAFKLAMKEGLKGGGTFVAKFGKTFVAIEGLTIVAKLFILSQVGQLNDGGTTSGPGFRNIADMGGDINNNAIEQKMMYSAPLSDKNIAKHDVVAMEYINQQESKKPVLEKYFALSDSRSAISIFANQLRYTAVIQPGQFLTHYLRSFSSCISNIISIVSPRTFAASDSSVKQHYGIVQWGWTEDENNLINSDSSYNVLENAQILSDNSSTVDEISAKYKHCFTDSMGTLLSGGYILRDENGDVIGGNDNGSNGACSPEALGPNNPHYGDLVFRWRLDQKRQSVLDQNTSIQNVSMATQ